MSNISMTVREIRELGLWDKVSEYLHINPWALNEGQISNDEVLEFDTEFKKKEEKEDIIKASWMRFKAKRYKTEDGDLKINLDFQDCSEYSGFEFYEEEIDDVIKVLQYLKERIK